MSCEGTSGESTKNDIAFDDEFLKELERWEKESKGRPMRVLVSGQGGIGKTTLINNLLQLEGDSKLKAGRTGKPITMDVLGTPGTTKSRIDVLVFDTPGLGDIQTDKKGKVVGDESIIVQMTSATKNLLDIVFYCIMLDGPTRVKDADRQAVKSITKAFTPKIWKRSVIVLTRANVLEKIVDSKTEYKEAIDNIKEDIKSVLTDKCGIDAQIVSEIPIVTAGKCDSILTYEEGECKNWEDRLFLEALKQVEPCMFPALFEAHTSLRLTLSMAGVIAGAMSGSVIGPLGSAIGAEVGAKVGRVIGGIDDDFKMQCALKKYSKWKNSEIPK